MWRHHNQTSKELFVLAAMYITYKDDIVEWMLMDGCLMVKIFS